ncbi:DinB family protein [Streptomyces sp. Rer75]|uniref:DinB family protein n=1 Tax=unclassified Streptomyces TaxID=2593676 RepID=UPI0015D06D86|nr:DinB family protein [Streptomyces sp. Rer75]QLH22652.1 DinB family protein [Streptomyces sp. Rer75]
MPTVVNPEACKDERTALLAYLDAQRGGIRRAVHGLTEEQARSAPSASALSLAGLIKHVTAAELGWIRTGQGNADRLSKETLADFEAGFVPTADETVPVLLERYEEVARETEAAVRALSSLDETFEAPRYPWDEGGTRTWRWLVLHLIQEVARHAGHADVIRETIDGKGAFDLVFETGAMPEPDWSLMEG